jgi:hypothetical protein
VASFNKKSTLIEVLFLLKIERKAGTWITDKAQTIRFKK